MRYRITLESIGPVEGEPTYEYVTYRDFPEREAGKGEPLMMKKISAFTEVYNTVRDEMKGQSTFRVKRIEEIPE